LAFEWAEGRGSYGGCPGLTLSPPRRPCRWSLRFRNAHLCAPNGSRFTVSLCLAKGGDVHTNRIVWLLVWRAVLGCFRDNAPGFAYCNIGGWDIHRMKVLCQCNRDLFFWIENGFRTSYQPPLHYPGKLKFVITELACDKTYYHGGSLRRLMIATT